MDYLPSAPSSCACIHTLSFWPRPPASSLRRIPYTFYKGLAALNRYYARSDPHTQPDLPDSTDTNSVRPRNKYLPA